MIAIIDNYDSFTYNIRDGVSQLADTPVRVFRNDAITVGALAALDPEALIVSPGPGTPDDAGISLEAIAHFAGRIPVLGICLGHQAIGQAFGGKIVHAKRVVHGKSEGIRHDGRGLFRGIAPASAFTRYHSLAVEESSLPSCLEVTARSEDGEIMGLRHREQLVEGVQFHPESVGSAEGMQVLRNFLHYRKEAFDRAGTLDTLMRGEPLSRSGAAGFFDELTDGNLPDAYIAAVLGSMGSRAADAEELVGCAEVLHRKKRAVRVAPPVLDTCGTGGDGLRTFNISSLAAITAAACGARVAKHGNRAVSSRSGCADYYEALGIDREITPERASELIERDGFAFLYAPVFHKAMRFAAPARKEMGVKTIMNLLGPLANPADAEYRLIGVYEDGLRPLMARAARLLGAKRVMTVHSLDGMDELSVAAPSRVFFIDENGTESDTTFDPGRLGIRGRVPEDLRGGTARENAEITWRLLGGEGHEAIREAVALNAGAALFVYGSAPSIEEGYSIATKAILDGTVRKKLETIVSAGSR